MERRVGVYMSETLLIYLATLFLSFATLSFDSRYKFYSGDASVPSAPRKLHQSYMLSTDLRSGIEDVAAPLDLC
jgi:hypothetical protein